MKTMFYHWFNEPDDVRIKINKRIRYLNKKGIFSKMENGYKVNIKAG